MKIVLLVCGKVDLALPHFMAPWNLTLVIPALFLSQGERQD